MAVRQVYWLVTTYMQPAPFNPPSLVSSFLLPSLQLRHIFDYFPKHSLIHFAQSHRLPSATHNIHAYLVSSFFSVKKSRLTLFKAHKLVAEEFWSSILSLLSLIYQVCVSAFVYCFPLYLLLPLNTKKSTIFTKQMLSHSTYFYSNQYDWLDYLDHHGGLQLKGYHDFDKDDIWLRITYTFGYSVIIWLRLWSSSRPQPLKNHTAVSL